MRRMKTICSVKGKSFSTSITCLTEREEKTRRSKRWKRTMGDYDVDVDGNGGEEDEGNDEIEGEVGEVT